MGQQFTVAVLEGMIAEREENLRLIAGRESEYVVVTDLPLQYRKAAQQHLQKIADMKAAIVKKKAQQGVPEGIDYGESFYSVDDIAAAHLLEEDLEATFGNEKWRALHRVRWEAFKRNNQWTTLVQPWLMLKSIPVPELAPPAQPAVPTPSSAPSDDPLAELCQMAEPADISAQEDAEAILVRGGVIGSMANIDTVIHVGGNDEPLIISSQVDIKNLWIAGVGGVTIGAQSNIKHVMILRGVGRKPSKGAMCDVGQPQMVDSANVVAIARQLGLV